MHDLRKLGFVGDRSGSMSVVGAVILLVVGVVGLVVVELSHLYLVRVRLQRTADLAGLAAIATPGAIVNGALTDAATATGRNVAALNGVRATEIVFTVEPSPSRDGSMSLRTTVSRDISLFSGRSFSSNGSKRVDAGSWVGVNDGSTPGGRPACVAAVWGSVRLSDQAVLTGSGCYVGAKTYMEVCGVYPGFPVLDVTGVTMGYRRLKVVEQLCAGASSSPPYARYTFSGSVTDSLATNASVTALKGTLSALAARGWPHGRAQPVAPRVLPPAPPALPLSIAGTATLVSTAVYGALTIANGLVTFPGSGSPDEACAAPTIVNGGLTLSGATRLLFAPGCYVVMGDIALDRAATASFETVPGVTFMVMGALSNGSGSLVLGAARYILQGEVRNIQGGSLTLGDGPIQSTSRLVNGSGTLTVGAGDHAFNLGIENRGGTIAIGDGAWLSLGGLSNAASGTIGFGSGPFTFYLCPISNSGTITFGNGPFRFDHSAISNLGTLRLGAGPFAFDAAGIWAGTNAITSLGVGDVTLYGNGFLDFNGGQATFGAGGSPEAGAGLVALLGGDLRIMGGTAFVADGVTFGLRGGSVFMVLTDPGKSRLIAPGGTRPSRGFKDLLIGSFSILDAWDPAGASGSVSIRGEPGTLTMAGTVYVPHGYVDLYGGVTVQPPSGRCLGAIAGLVSIREQVRVTARPCFGLTAAVTSSAPALIQ
ncbi:Putative Flp pilus-assembly TadE/G-like [Methylobacterium sp. 174MFSha1.1]|uniref:pilus assembly protein TadG-related protein n=1 Tax=Methylobacterium sp. 174MFSha1.1 TaxID=1502749 RepID=UPI0008F0333D|nr:pilus assembly protein TadG-related protein [Methylobacterium sp. 174MFSha1.1]SFU49393.1 Putative Flp pilus-assembly TadE/G-like [Methylobacterium sp. 174MFSha1.1]